MKDIAKDLYEKLGHLFYAIAYVDKFIAPEEIKRLQVSVRQQWIPAEPPHSAVHVQEILDTFHRLKKEQMPADEAFEVFRSYIQAHKSQLDEDLITRIMDTANAITIAYAKRNKSESVLISRLYQLLK